MLVQLRTRALTAVSMLSGILYATMTAHGAPLSLRKASEAAVARQQCAVINKETACGRSRFCPTSVRERIDLFRRFLELGLPAGALVALDRGVDPLVGFLD